MDKTIGKEDWAICGWPGLPQLWRGGALTGLALAVTAALGLNLLLLTTFVWTELLSPQAKLAGWSTLFVGWGAAGGVSYWRQRQAALANDEDAQTALFTQAVAEYLQGNWYAAEMALGRLLKLDRRDPEALLMLATLCRHTDRLDEAARRLDELERLESATRWRSEIARERTAVAQKRGQLDPSLIADETVASDVSENAADAASDDQAVLIGEEVNGCEQSSAPHVDILDRPSAEPRQGTGDLRVIT